MRTKFFLLLLALLILPEMSQRAIAQTMDPATQYNLINAQTNWTLMQQQQQMASMVEAQQKQAQDLMKQQQISSLAQFFVGSCGQMFNRGERASDGKVDDLKDTADDMEDIAYADIEAKGYTYDSKWDRETARTIGAESTLAFKAGCNNFINKEGQLGPWGNYAMGLIRGKSEVFGGNIPGDITRWCPKYPSMNESQRELYWVWILGAMASNESGCNPGITAQGPNGTAKGLFQVWEPVCPKARNLARPRDNIQCAVDLLADELKDRDNLMSTTSNGKRKDATYWAVLRIDGRDKGNSVANAKTRAIMEKYKFCH
jgi:hypothetical protein